MRETCVFGADGQGLLQLEELGMAFLLSAFVGIEREIRQKSAGLRTYTLVGVASALFMLVSKYGFMDVLSSGRVMVDPSRVAAQIVSGIGFIGGGVIFMRRDSVRGLTTAASVWMTAALGSACGAGLMGLALAAGFIHFIVMFALPPLLERLPHQMSDRAGIFLTYEDGRGLLRSVLVRCAQLRFTVAEVRIDRMAGGDPVPSEAMQNEAGETIPARGHVTLYMHVTGPRPVAELVTALSEIGGVKSVGTQGGDAPE